MLFPQFSLLLAGFALSLSVSNEDERNVGIPSTRNGQPTGFASMVLTSVDDVFKDNRKVYKMGRSRTTGEPVLLADESGLPGGLTESIRYIEAKYKAKMEFNHFRLPKEGILAKTPWPSGYWPSFKDGINNRLVRERESTSELYARAYGLDKSKFMEWVSRKAVNGPSCPSGTGCSFQFNDPVKFPEGICIPTWTGICHAWSIAAITEPEPKCPVKVNGVTFTTIDIKSLASQIYDETHLIGAMTGGKICASSDIPQLDNNGRYSQASCRDIAPDFFHLMMTNVLGRFKQSFLLDVDTHRGQIWNHPAYAFKITESSFVDKVTAAKMINPRLNEYTFNYKATMFVKITADFQYITEYDTELTTDKIPADKFIKTVKYEYILELDNAGTIIGGEWVGESKTKHPDIVWIPWSKLPENLVTAGGLSYANIKYLINESIAGTC